MPRVVWGETEWDKLAESVWKMLKNDPTATLIQLSNKAVKQFPKEDQRILRTNKDVVPLIKRISKFYDGAQCCVAELKIAQQKLEQRQTAEELLESISDEEVLRLYKDRIFSMVSANDILSSFNIQDLLDDIPTSRLVGIVTERLAENILEQKELVSPTPITPLNNRLKENKYRQKVAIIGMISEQSLQLEKRLSNIDVIAVQPKQELPQNADLYIAWTKFISHNNALQMKKFAPSNRFVYHSGGLRTMATLINKYLKE